MTNTPASSSFPNKSHNPTDNFNTPKSSSLTKETRLAKVRCFKCQGFGHYQSSCPNKRVVTVREAMECRDELREEEHETRGGLFNLDEPNQEDEQAEIYEAPIYDTCLVIRSLQIISEPGHTEQRAQLFHTKCQVNEKWCSVVIDGGSCTNAALNEMVPKVALPTMTHPEPYALHWLNDGKKVEVSKQVRVCFTMGSYEDEVLCDVVPMDVCQVLLGRPWQYDRDVTQMGRSNEYMLFSKGKKVVLKPMPSQAVRAMYTSRKKSPYLSMLAMRNNLERTFKKEESKVTHIDPFINFNPSPLFDRYGDEEEVVSVFKAPCNSFGDNYEFGQFAQQVIQPDSQNSGVLFYSPTPVPNTSSSLLLVFVIHFANMVVVFAFDSGEARIQELRSISFKGGVDDMVDEAVDINPEASLLATVTESSGSRMHFVCMVSHIDGCNLVQKLVSL